MSSDTIVAIATATGRGAVGIVRISGPAAVAIAERAVGKLPPPRQAALRSFKDEEERSIDHGLVLFFPAPRSFTGEDVVEFQAHGGAVVLDLLLRALCRLGARLARPGEFSERAFLNGQIDLAQAEAIADLIDAGSDAAVRAASRSLEGEFSKRCNEVVDLLIGLRADLEAALDFADEDVPWLSSATLSNRLCILQERLQSLLKDAAQGRRLREGMTVAIAGRPNVGKSTLLNRFAGTDVAIVSPIAGTTRDVLREHIVVEGLPLTIVDTAGLRDTEDPIEREGVARARAALAKAELALLLVDDNVSDLTDERKLIQQLPTNLPYILVRNKCDVSGRPVGRSGVGESTREVGVSAASGAGIPALCEMIREAAGLSAHTESLFSARTRHVEALRSALARITAARQRHNATGVDAVAEELRLAQQDLEAITGRFTPDDLLDRIFATFCLGK